MTSETRTTIEVTDVKAIELECTKCGFRTTWPLGQWKGRYVKCATCGESWPVLQNALYEALDRIVTSLSEIANADRAAIPFRIRFELSERKG